MFYWDHPVFYTYIHHHDKGKFIHSIPKKLIPSAAYFWLIANIGDYPNAQVSIYMLYQSKGFYRPWDGTYNGSGVPAGTYYYMIKTDSRIKDLSGYLVLIR